MKKLFYLFFLTAIALLVNSCDYSGTSTGKLIENLVENLDEEPEHSTIPEPTGLLANDFAGIFTQEQVEDLEKWLNHVDSKEKVQILLVVTPDLDKYEISDYAQQIGDEWNVGNQLTNRGVVIVIKPKNETNGEVLILARPGLENVLTEARCNKIVNDRMIPFFKEDDYYGAIVSATDYIAMLVSIDDDNTSSY